MNVGSMHWGSRYIEQSLSIRRGRVGRSGRGIERSAKSCFMSSSAAGDERLGNGRSMAASMPGMKSIRRKGAEKFVLGVGISEFMRSLCCETCSARPENSFSVMEITSSRFAYAI